MKRFRVLATLSGVAVLSVPGVSIAAAGAKHSSGPTPKQMVLARCLEAKGAQIDAASLNHGYVAARLSDPALVAALRACRATAGVPDTSIGLPGESKPGASKPAA